MQVVHWLMWTPSDGQRSSFPRDVTPQRAFTAAGNQPWRNKGFIASLSKVNQWVFIKAGYFWGGLR